MKSFCQKGQRLFNYGLSILSIFRFIDLKKTHHSIRARLFGAKMCDTEKESRKDEDCIEPKTKGPESDTKGEGEDIAVSRP